MMLTKKKKSGANLETKLLEVRHMSKPKNYYLVLAYQTLFREQRFQPPWPRKFVGKCARKVHVQVQAECGTISERIPSNATRRFHY